MKKLENSFTIVLNGDWNILYTQPDWLADNIFEKSEIEVGINGIGSHVNVLYKCGDIVINPSQSQVIFSVDNENDDNINQACKYVNNFLTKAYTPQLNAFGLNAVFEDSGEIIASIFDNCWSIVRALGYDKEEASYD